MREPMTTISQNDLFYGDHGCPPARTRPCRASPKHLGELGHERLVGEVEPQRRHGDAVVGEGRQVGTVAERRAQTLERHPVVRIAAAVAARLDAQQFLVALALAGDGDALYLV